MIFQRQYRECPEVLQSGTLWGKLPKGIAPPMGWVICSEVASMVEWEESAVMPALPQKAVVRSSEAGRTVPTSDCVKTLCEV